MYDTQIPNLDDIPTSERKVFAVIFASLADYCTAKTTAEAHRKAGLIDAAMKCEKECERIYETLPKWARW